MRFGSLFTANQPKPENLFWPPVQSFVFADNPVWCVPSFRNTLNSESIGHDQLSKLSALLTESLTPKSAHNCIITSCSVEIDNAIAAQEGYAIAVTPIAASQSLSCSLKCSAIKGCIHGIYTIGQLLNHIDSVIPSSGLHISDYPDFPHRGVLLDTSRRFLPLHILKTHLDLLAHARMNVLHWHVTDDHSFPIQLSCCSNATVYSHKEVYTAADVRELISYGNQRGVEVLIEIDMPGHLTSLTNGYPHLIGRASSGLDPTSEASYEFIDSLFSELVSDFGINRLHVGGDETGGSWKTPAIKEWMAADPARPQNDEELIAYWISRLSGIAAKKNISLVLWDDFLRETSKVGDWVDGKTWQVWLGNYDDAKRLAEEHKVIYSHQGAYYLDHLDLTWDTMFEQELRPTGKLLGAETCMWGEASDAINSVSRVWPRSAAVAARLWANSKFSDNGRGNSSAAGVALARWICRMRALGYGVDCLAMLGKSISDPETPWIWGSDKLVWSCPQSDIVTEISYPCFLITHTA